MIQSELVVSVFAAAIETLTGGAAIMPVATLRAFESTSSNTLSRLTGLEAGC